MITDEEMQKALETVKEYCKERRCFQCNYCFTCSNYFKKNAPQYWAVLKDD